MDGRTDGQGDSYITPQTLLTDQDEMNNLHRGHSIDASYQVSVVAMFVNRSGQNEQLS
jgi:hypothetical protein